MQELKSKYSDLLNFNKEEIQLRSNLFDISGSKFSEDTISNWYAFFLNDKLEHSFYNLFLNSLLEIVNEIEGFEKFSMDGCEVIREYYTGKGFVDFVIYDGDKVEMRNAIIIENKVNAALDNDLADYYRSVEVKEGKVGILLTLNKITFENENFTNVTHQEWVNKIKGNLSKYWLKSDEKYLFYLKDFISNLESLSKKIEMNNNIKFYIENVDKINELVSLKTEAENYIVDSIAKEITNSKELFWVRKNQGTITIGINESNFRIYISHTKIFEETKFGVAFWIDDQKSIEKFTPQVRRLMEEEFGNLISNWRQEGTRWLEIAQKEYSGIQKEDIKKIGKYIVETIEKDFNSIINYVNTKIL